MIGALRSSLRWKLGLAFALVMLLPTITLSSYNLVRSGNLLFTLTRAERLNVAQSRVDQAEAAMRTVATDLLFLTQTPGMRRYANTGDSSSSTDLLLAFLQQHRDRYHGLCLLDVGGREQSCLQVTATGVIQVPRDQLADRYDQDYFQAALSRLSIPGENPLYLSYLDPSHVSDGNVVQVMRYASALRSEGGEVAGVLVLQINAAVLYQLLASSNPNVYTIVIDRDGRVIFRSEPAMVDLGALATELWPSDSERLLREPSGQITNSVDQAETFRTFIRLRADQQLAPGWIIIYDMPLQLINQPVYESLLVNLLLTLSALAVTIVVAAAITRSILRPVQQLAQAAQKIGAGALETAIPQAGADEIGALGRTLATTVDRLRESLIVAQQENAERRRLEVAEARLIALIEASSDFVGIADSDGRVLYLNQAGRRYIRPGLSEELMIVAFHPAWAAQRVFEEGLPHAAQHGTWLGESALLTVEDEEIPVSQLIVAHYDEFGHPERFSTVIRDIRPIRLAEERLRQSQKMEAIGRLAGGVAHDFNNLLTVIIGTGELALSELPPQSPLREDLNQILNAGARASDLTRQLLAFSRRQVLKPELLDINERIIGIERMLRRLIGEDISLVVEPAADLRIVQVDPGQIEQVLLNLAINARDAMPDGGELRIGTANLTVGPQGDPQFPDAPPGELVHLFVSDSGQGMTDEVRRRAFEPFFTTKQIGKGTGLGLSTVHGIVSQSGGAISVMSSPGRGTRFDIFFPAVQGHVQDVDPKTPIALPVGSNVLLAEDEAPLREFVLRVLVRNGFHVVAAENGVEALTAAATMPRVDLLISDVVMPGGLSGPQLAEALRVGRSDLRVLYISGYGDSFLMRQQLNSPATRLLTKPFGADELLLAVAEMFQEAGR